jgi:UDP-N-acetylmuramoylalanine--D-glutamate ligase
VGQGITLILGTGRSGLAAARLLVAAGEPVRLADEKALPASLPRELAGTERCAGAFQAEWLDGVARVLLSPGVPPTSPALRACLARSLPITGELEEAFLRCPVPILAVTGSNGKSTVTSLAAHLLVAQGRRAPAGGNLGRPLAELLVDEPDAELYVVEVSSFQAETFSRFHPRSATLLNLSPDHLDRYGRLEDYYAAKLKLFATMGPADTLVLGEDAEAARRLADCPARRLPFRVDAPLPSGAEGTFLADGRLAYRFAGRERKLLAAEALPIPGRHNLANALAALALVLPFGDDADALSAGLASFRGLAHRMEEVGRLGPLRCFNDSKATNVEAALAGVAGLSAPVLLIAGGRDKGGDFGMLAAGLPGVRLAFGIGEAGGAVARAFGARGRELGTLAAAVAAAREEGRAGELLVLSPACASYDQYKNFEERGAHFRRLVQEASA